MSEDRRAQLKRLLESGQRNLQPLTFPQRELWEASPVPPHDVSNHICAFIEVQGTITEKDCISALQGVVDRQEVMRLSFIPGKGNPLQMTRPTGTATVTFRDLTAAECHPEALEEIMQGIFREPFDLTKGPLYRIAMLRRAPNDLVLAFTIHHAIADGWSLGVFVQDIAASYIATLIGGKPQPLPPVPQTYSAWGAAERAYWVPSEIESRASFWKSSLNGAPRLWDSKIIAPPSSYLLRRWITEVPADQAREVREFTRKSGNTLFSTLLGAFQIAFSKWNGSDDFVVGTPVANRQKPACKETMGYFAGNVPLRLKLDPQQSFSEAHKELHDGILDAFAHAIPFAELVKVVDDLPAPNRNPVYEVRFALQNHPVPDVAVPGLSLKLRMRSTGTSRFGLGCEVTEDGHSFEVVWLYREPLFPQTEIENLHQLFLTVLTRICRSPESRITTLMP